MQAISTAVPPPWCAGGNSTWGSALLNFSRTFSNFPEVRCLEHTKARFWAGLLVTADTTYYYAGPELWLTLSGLGLVGALSAGILHVV